MTQRHKDKEKDKTKTKTKTKTNTKQGKGKECVMFLCDNDPQQVDYLKDLGVTECFDSRDVDGFSGDILSRGGVDVVINSLANRAMLKSIALCNTR